VWQEISDFSLPAILYASKNPHADQYRNFCTCVLFSSNSSKRLYLFYDCELDSPVKEGVLPTMVDVSPVKS
jgi:hypothetical protein